MLIGQVNEQGQPHGVARMIHTDGRYIREGSFVNGKLHGFGRVIYVNYYYIGEWDNHSRFQGTRINRYGTYKGALVQGYMHGEGTWTTNKGK